MSKYNDPELIDSIKEIFDREGIVQLNEFVEDREKLVKIARRLKKEYNPLRYSFESAEIKESEVREILEFVNKIKEGKITSMKCYQFCHKDYTLMNDNQYEEEGMTVIIELTPSWKKESGGFSSWIKDNEEAYRLYPIPDSLTLVKTTRAMKSFVKYVNKRAGELQRIYLKVKIRC